MNSKYNVDCFIIHKKIAAKDHIISCIKCIEINFVVHNSEFSLILFGRWPLQVATGMVAGTFLAAPLMFVSARMLSVVVVSEMDYKDLLLQTSFDASVISMVACVSDGTWHSQLNWINDCAILRLRYFLKLLQMNIW